jgi:hypothetical protein
VGGRALSGARVVLTIDLDLIDHMAGGAETDELDGRLDPLLEILRRHPDWKATWLVRLDAQVERRFGHAEAPFDRAKTRLAEFVRAGHELAWHPHCFVHADNAVRPNEHGPSVADELRRYAPIARALGLRAMRMGWAFHTNETMRAASDAGFAVDSSAVPRPRYPWDHGAKDWSTTPPDAYRPSAGDYRVPGTPALPILEVPMSVAAIRAPYDSGDVVRYLNPAYRPEALTPVLRTWFASRDTAVLVTHPHELFPRGRAHGLIASTAEAFETNVAALESGARAHGREVRFLTLSDAKELAS